MCFMRVYGYYSEQARVGELLEGRAHRGRAAAGPSACEAVLISTGGLDLSGCELSDVVGGGGGASNAPCIVAARGRGPWCRTLGCSAAAGWEALSTETLEELHRLFETFPAKLIIKVRIGSVWGWLPFARVRVLRRKSCRAGPNFHC